MDACERAWMTEIYTSGQLDEEALHCRQLLVIIACLVVVDYVNQVVVLYSG